MSTMELFAQQTDETSSSTEIGRVFFPNAIPTKPLEFDRSKIKEHSPEEIERAKAALKKEHQYFSSTANWLTSEDGFVNYEPYRGRACHAALPRHDDRCFKNLIATENGWARAHISGASFISPFLSWFLYDSPYGEFILNRDDFDFCFNYGFILSGSLPQPLLMNICIISRHFYELDQKTFTTFNSLTSKGFDPTLCYSMLFNSYGSYTPTAAYMPYGGHRAASSYSPVDLLNMYRGVYGCATTDTMTRVNSIYGASKLFCSEPDQSVLTWAKGNKEFLDALRGSRGQEKEGYRPPNPFKLAPPRHQRVMQAHEFTNEEAVDFVIPYLDTYLRKEMGLA